MRSAASKNKQSLRPTVFEPLFELKSDPTACKYFVLLTQGDQNKICAASKNRTRIIRSSGGRLDHVGNCGKLKRFYHLSFWIVHNPVCTVKYPTLVLLKTSQVFSYLNSCEVSCYDNTPNSQLILFPGLEYQLVGIYPNPNTLFLKIY